MRWEVLPVLTALVPLAWTWWIHRRTALVHALSWAIVAWAGWVAEALMQSAPSRFVAVALTACTGVAVLGARRPGAGAWNGVVAGLFAVFMLPVARQFFFSTGAPIDPLWQWSVGLIVAVVCANYIFTKLRWPAATALIVCLLHIGYTHRGPTPNDEGVVEYIGPIVPWLAWFAIVWRTMKPADFDETWLGFRDRFGAIWALRLKTQFNAAAKNSGWKFALHWDGLHNEGPQPIPDAKMEEARRLLVSLMQRFGWP